MKAYSTSKRILPIVLSLGLCLGGAGPIEFIPSAAAATSAEKRKSRKLKKENRQLKKKNRTLKIQLAAALVPPTTPGMVLIPGGPFNMGDADDGATGGAAHELPVHIVTVSDFYLDEFEVTKALWDEVRAWGTVNGYTDLPAGGGEGRFHPVHSVNWYAVVKWCNARSEMEGLAPVYYTDAARTTVYRSGNNDLENGFVKWTANGFRLPTEAEWEKAARGNENLKTYPWGNSIADEDANYQTSGDPFDIGGVETTPVGFYDGGQIPAGPDRANGYGLYDMAGNVNEWCWDSFESGWYSDGGATVQDTRGPAFVANRVARGGAYIAGISFLRCSDRSFGAPTLIVEIIGFRCARGH
jgi:formylglycine-generating enzyme required for sulfatase activity